MLGAFPKTGFRSIFWYFLKDIRCMKVCRNRAIVETFLKEVMGKFVQVFMPIFGFFVITFFLVQTPVAWFQKIFIIVMCTHTENFSKFAFVYMKRQPKMCSSFQQYLQTSMVNCRKMKQVMIILFEMLERSFDFIFIFIS